MNTIRYCSISVLNKTLLAGCLLLASASPASAQQPPTISVIANQSILQGTSTPVIPVSVADPDTAVESLALTVFSDNPVLVPNVPEALLLGGSGSMRTLKVTPDPYYSGLANITVQVTDGISTVRRTFALAVDPQPQVQVTRMTNTAPIKAVPSDDSSST